MVLSLPFILAFIGSAVGLVIGMVIYGDISEAIECPASGTGGGGGGGGETVAFIQTYDNLGTLGSGTEALYYEFEAPSNFVSTTGRINQGVIQNGTSSLDSNGEIVLDGDRTTWSFLHGGGVGMDEVSVNLWINGDVDGSPTYPILTNRNQFSGNGFNLLTQGTTTYLYVYEAGTNRLSSSASTIPPDDSQWHMLTVTYDKSITTGNPNAVIYLDGVAVGGGNTDSDFDGTGFSANYPLTIGSDADHDIGGGVTENTFNVDDVAIWNGYILTSTDVTNLYNSGSGMAASSVSSSDLVGYWSFDTTTANIFEYEIGGVLFDTLGETSDGSYQVSEGWFGQLVATTGEPITAVTINDLDNSNSHPSTLTAEIWTGATTDIDSSTLVATSDNILELNLGTGIIDFTWVFDPPVTVNDPDTYIGLHTSNWDSNGYPLTSSVDIGSGVFWVHDDLTTSGFSTPLGFADMLMKVETAGNETGGGGGGGEAETGSEQCQQAKDISWTVIGIIPVALFFSLFAIFSALGTGRQ